MSCSGDADTPNVKEGKGELKTEPEETVDTTGNEDAAVEPVVPSASQITAEMMQNPQILAALQNQIDGIVGNSSGYIESLPKAVKRRINALKNLQVKSMNIESKFFEEVHDLERKYMEIYAPLFDRRREIVSGKIEPTDSECEWESEADEEDEDQDNKESKKNKDEVNALTNQLGEKVKVEEDKTEEEVMGIPEFWLTIFKSTEVLMDMIQDHDEPILKSLKDIRASFSGPNEQMGFTLEFIFEPNDYFTNTMLKKHYKLRAEPDDKDPFSFDGPEIISCTGCKIDWKKGKNVTVKQIKKKQKHKGRGTTRTVRKEVANDSFFNFFSPPEVKEESEVDSDTENLLASDFEIGHMIRERIVPRAVLYFTGEAQMDYDYDEEEEEMEEEGGHFGESADSENSEDDSDYNPEDPKTKETPQECKQQ